jgi:cell division transport system permease protein
MEPPKFKVRKKKLGSYPFLNAVLSITVALLVIGVFGALVIYARELENVVRRNVNIQVFLKNTINEAQRLQIQKNLSAQYFLPPGNPEGTIRFISKEDAAKQVAKDIGEDFLKFIGENPLHDAFMVSVDAKFQDPKSMEKIKIDVGQISGVFDVYYVPNVIARINANIAVIGVVLMGIAGLLLIVVVILINNTIRLALFSQRFLIRSMQLVGATSWFIQGPFLARAAFQGLAAGIFAGGILAGILSLATKKLVELQSIQNTPRLSMLLGSLLVLGIFVAVLSTYRAVSKYLKLSLDELY